MDNIGGILMLFLFVSLGFVGFVIYFIFKQLEFVIRAINLYEKMINRQDTMIKLLMQLKEAALGHEVSETEEVAQEDLSETESWRGSKYKKQHETKGKALCIACRTVDEASTMLYCVENDTYIHQKCIGEVVK